MRYAYHTLVTWISCRARCKVCEHEKVLSCGSSQIQDAGRKKSASCRSFRSLFQSCTLAQTTSTPDLTLTLTLTPSIRGALGRQGQPRGTAACFVGVFLRNPGRPKRPPSTNPTGIYIKLFPAGFPPNYGREIIENPKIKFA